MSLIALKILFNKYFYYELYKHIRVSCILEVQGITPNIENVEISILFLSRLNLDFWFLSSILHCLKYVGFN